MRFIFLLLLTGCNLIENIHFEVDPRLKEVVDEFYYEAEIRGVQLIQERVIVRVGKINSTALYESGKIPMITINESLFLNGSPDKVALRYIVFHEFGHYLGRGHCNCYSIMNPNKYAGEYRNNIESRLELDNELFQWR
jgi:Zn-dependent peptidase ImmA (M78 family)